ncbi:MAG: hypothetical protein Q7U53_15250 [Anaerolineaceae bacterium]|nr:hypothetical protein [Anaerolineaceae bacterium]
MHSYFLAASALSLIAAVVFWHPVPLMISIFLGIVGFAERKAGPNILAAIKAYDTGTPTDGEVSISITSWDMDNHYHATVREDGHSDWEYEFIPQYWQPAAGSYPAKIWRTDGEGMPILVVAEEGILIPRTTPKKPADAVN